MGELEPCIIITFDVYLVRSLILFLLIHMLIALFKQIITYLEDKLSPFLKKGFLRSVGKCWCLIIYS